jgi:amidohydrolase
MQGALKRSMNMKEISHDLIARAVSWRHHLHRHPELAYHETRTADFVANQLVEFGLSVHRGLAGTGVVGTLSRGTSRRTIAIRADMDALPIQEHSGAQHASGTPGIMHACGHDGHVVMALTAASICSCLPNLDGTVHFIFQPAEENEGGGRRMVEDGLFRMFPCDAVYALHNWPALSLGVCVARDGPMMAALGTFEIVVSGRGCHGGMPNEGTDSVLAACQLVSALQSIVSRNVDPLQASVVSATQISGGNTWNVLPENCTIRGTTRWFDEQVGHLLEHRISDLSKAVAAGFGCSAQILYQRRLPATVNSPDAARFMRNVASTRSLSLNVIDAAPSMGSEDFAFMLQATPGCYAWLGAAKAGDNPGLHSPRYDFNDALIPLGVRLWVSAVCESLTVP